VTLGGYGEWGHGDVVFPLDGSVSDSTPLLELADPALAAVLAFLPEVLQLQLGAALTAYAAIDGIVISDAVISSTNAEPVPALYADRTRFPFFALYRKGETYATHTVAFDKSVSEWEFAYVLPPLMPQPQERIVPILHAVASVIRKALHVGYHPLYEDGAEVLKDAGIMSSRLVSVRYERYERMASAAGSNAEQFFRAVVGTIEVVEVDRAVVGAFEAFTGANVNVDQESEDGTTIADGVALATSQKPTVTLVSPNSGTKAGNTAITITGTLFAPGPTPRVFIGGAECTSVVRVSTTSMTARTPAHDAYPTFMADVVVTNGDGQSGTLSAGYTFTTP